MITNVQNVASNVPSFPLVLQRDKTISNKIRDVSVSSIFTFVGLILVVVVLIG